MVGTNTNTNSNAKLLLAALATLCTSTALGSTSSCGEVDGLKLKLSRTVAAPAEVTAASGAEVTDAEIAELSAGIDALEESINLTNPNVSKMVEFLDLSFLNPQANDGDQMWGRFRVVYVKKDIPKSIYTDEWRILLPFTDKSPTDKSLRVVHTSGISYNDAAARAYKAMTAYMRVIAKGPNSDPRLYEKAFSAASSAIRREIDLPVDFRSDRQDAFQELYLEYSELRLTSAGYKFDEGVLRRMVKGWHNNKARYQRDGEGKVKLDFSAVYVSDASSGGKPVLVISRGKGVDAKTGSQEETSRHQFQVPLSYADRTIKGHAEAMELAEIGMSSYIRNLIPTENKSADENACAWAQAGVAHETERIEKERNVAPSMTWLAKEEAAYELDAEEPRAPLATQPLALDNPTTSFRRMLSMRSNSWSRRRG